MSYLVFLFGLIIGSFLNVLADRLPKGEDVLWGRSHCDHCRRILRWYELIPVISYFYQRGRCGSCRKALSSQYPAIEVLTGVGFAILYTQIPQSIVLYLSAVTIFCTLLVITIADLKYQIIPDSMIVTSLVGSIFWLVFNLSFSQIIPHLLSGIGALVFFYTLWYVTKGKSMGFGDVKLSGVLGLLLGFPLVISALYIAFLTGAVVGVILILRGKKSLKSKIAFGPFMVLGACISIVFSTYIVMLWKTFI